MTPTEKKYSKYVGNMYWALDRRWSNDHGEYLNNYDSKLPIDPYILGILIGDGSLSRTVELTTADPEILSEFKKFTEAAKLKLVECSISGK